MPSIFDNGGMIGATLDFGSEERYIVGTTPAPIEFVGSTGTGQTITGSSINLPSGMQEGDFVIVATSSDGSTPATPTGYTLGQSGNTNSVGYMWAYKVMGATPDTTATGLTSNSTTTHAAFVFRNIASVSSFATAATAISGMPNSPSIFVSQNNLVIAIGFLDDDNIAASVTAPSTHALAASSQASSLGASVMASYKIAATTGTEDPAAFGGSGDDSWVATTVQLAKGSNTVPVYGNYKNSGIWSLDAVLEAATIPVTSLSFVTSANANVASITIPATAQAGDLAVLYQTAADSSAVPTDTLPSGFTSLGSVTGDYGSGFSLNSLSYKILTAGEPGTSITGSSGSAGSRKLIAIFRPNVPINTVTTGTASTEFTTGDPATQTILTGGAGVPQLVFAQVYGAAAPTINQSPASAITSMTTSGPTHWAGYRIANITGLAVDVAFDANDTGLSTAVVTNYLVVT